MYCSTIYPSPIGLLTLACDEDSLTGLWIEGQKYHGNVTAETAVQHSDSPVLTAAKKWLDSYFAGKKPTPSQLPLAPFGSTFRRQIWDMLCEIPYGTVITYGGIAQKMAVKMNRKSMSCQAVGGAVGHNPISIIIPCHRVVGSKGSLTGYAGGIDRKIKLLELEGADMSNLFIPRSGTAL